MEEMQAPTNASTTGNAERSRWYFTKQDLAETPSIKSGIPFEKETSYRQQAANFIQDMGQHLRVTQLCINTAIVYCQRFYMFHSFQRFHRNSIALASLFLAAKVEEQPRKLEHVIKMAHVCLNGKDGQLDIRSETYQEKAQELVTNENILLQTLGFDVAIDHPHTHVVRCCQLVKASKELAQASYYLATNSLHLTTMCLRYSPTIVACFVIHLACKWSNYKIPLSNQNKEWFSYVDSSATLDVLEEMTSEFLLIYEQCPSRLKKKIRASTQAAREDEEHKQMTNACSYSNGASGVTFPAISQHSDNEQRRTSSQSSSRSTSSQLHSYGSNNKTSSGHSSMHSSSSHPSSGHHQQSSSGHSLSSHGSSSQKTNQPPHSLPQHHSQYPQHHKHHPSASKDSRSHQQSNHNVQPQSRYHSQQGAPNSSQNNNSSSLSRSSSHPTKPSTHHPVQYPDKHSGSQSHHSSHRGVSGQHIKTQMGAPDVSKTTNQPSHNDFPLPRQHQGSNSHEMLVSQKPTQGHSSHSHRPPVMSNQPKERSIFDIDSPEKPKVDAKTSSISKPLHGLLPKAPKVPSLFSPPSDSETKTLDYPAFSHPSLPKKSDSFLMRDFNMKEEPKAHLDDFISNSVIKKEPSIEEKPHNQSIYKLPMELQSTSGQTAIESQDDRREKKHKEKKKKKSKDKEKDREPHTHDGQDRVHKEHKKHKHKSKDKEREREKGRYDQSDHVDRQNSAAGGGLKLKIKLDPEPAALAPIKLNIGKMKNGDDPARKRSRGDSESGSGPASKMSRVLGTSVETESQFLQNVGSASSSSHHSLKSSKKISSR